MTQLSIIVPVYNVEKYIRPSIESIYRQGLDDACFEVIIINDGTKDDSMEEIQDIIEEHDNITVVNQDNQGLSVARNIGISIARGEYICMPDSDDLIIDNSLSKLLEIALSTKADLVVADFLIMNDEAIENIQPITQKEFEIKEKTGTELFIEDLDPNQCYVWRTLFRKDFIQSNHLKFVPGVVYQDVPFINNCYILAKKCIRTSWLFNIYRIGHESATSFFNKKKAKDFCIVIAKTWELTNIEGLSPRVQKKLIDNIFTSFSAMICSTVHVIEKASDRNEIIDFLKEQAPDLRFNNGFKQNLKSFMYRNYPHTYLQIRYLYAQIVENRIRPFFYHRLRRRFMK